MSSKLSDWFWEHLIHLTVTVVFFTVLAWIWMEVERPCLERDPKPSWVYVPISCGQGCTVMAPMETHQCLRRVK